MRGAARPDDVIVSSDDEVLGALSGHVIVCGLHDVGLRIVEQLQAAGETVIVVDDDPNPRLLRITPTSAWRTLPASAQRASTLRSAGIDRAVAIVCVVPDELRNLEIALLARSLQPDLRVVVQLTNQAVGRAVARVTGAGTVLDVATLAAPSFVEACLARRTHELELAGQQFRILEKTVETAGTLRALFGDLAPVAVVPADGQRHRTSALAGTCRSRPAIGSSSSARSATSTSAG